MGYLTHILLDVIIPALIRPTFEKLGDLIAEKIFSSKSKQNIGF